jgi:hypothetical protein
MKPSLTKFIQDNDIKEYYTYDEDKYQSEIDMKKIRAE